MVAELVSIRNNGTVPFQFEAGTFQGGSVSLCEGTHACRIGFGPY